MRSSVSSIGTALGGRINLMAALALLLVFAVSMQVAHGHENDPGKQLDCEICLKHGGEDDFIASCEADSVTPPAGKFLASVTPVPLPVEIPEARSRSPPLS